MLTFKYIPSDLCDVANVLCEPIHEMTPRISYSFVNHSHVWGPRRSPCGMLSRQNYFRHIFYVILRPTPTLLSRSLSLILIIFPLFPVGLNADSIRSIFIYCEKISCVFGANAWSGLHAVSIEIRNEPRLHVSVCVCLAMYPPIGLVSLGSRVSHIITTYYASYIF